MNRPELPSNGCEVYDDSDDSDSNSSQIIIFDSDPFSQCNYWNDYMTKDKINVENYHDKKVEASETSLLAFSISADGKPSQQQQQESRNEVHSQREFKDLTKETEAQQQQDHSKKRKSPLNLPNSILSFGGDGDSHVHDSDDNNDIISIDDNNDIISIYHKSNYSISSTTKEPEVTEKTSPAGHFQQTHQPKKGTETIGFRRTGSIEQLDLLSGKVVHRYSSITLAARIMKTSMENISMRCRGDQNVNELYGWRYFDGVLSPGK